MLFNRFRKARKFVAVNLVILMLAEIFLPSAMALTGGPSQPEFQQFTPVGMNDLVDPFTGDFKYNIPLFDIGGYPVNLAYNSNISIEDEASWVGLGWSLNPGSINRNMRGVPDDFNGDEVVEQMNIKENKTIGGKLNAEVELFGFLGLGTGPGIYHNTYNGWGFEMSNSISLNCGDKSDANSQIGLDLNYNTQAGLSVSASLGAKTGNGVHGSFGVNGGFNTRTGLQQLNFNSSINAGAIESNMRADGHISFGNPTYFPGSEFPMINKSFTADIGFGGAFWGLYGKGKTSGYYTSQKLDKKEITTPAYGLMYEKNSDIKERVIHDYNKDKEVPYRSEMLCIAQAYSTPDIFNYNSQAGSGQFQLTRNDLGSFAPAYSQSTGVTGYLGTEAGPPSEFGLTGGIGSQKSFTGTWQDGNEAGKKLKFSSKNISFPGSTKNDALYEPYYFYLNGELTPSEESFWNQFGGKDVTAVSLNPLKTEKATNFQNFVNKGLGPAIQFNLNNPVQKNSSEKRRPRNTAVLALNGEEASAVSLSKSIKLYPENDFDYCSQDFMNDGRVSANRSRSHISEIQMVNSDGSRSIFGMPVYNITQEEISFAVDPANGGSKDLVNYKDKENSLNNDSGTDNYYKRKVIPPYATTYLISEILSSDYVDREGNGPSSDDLGNYIKFNYFKTKNTKWRAPFKQNQAKWNKGSLVDPLDDKASITYGERENKYLHSIESNKEVAYFYTSERFDERNFQNANGNPNTAPGKSSRKLDKIVVYSVFDLKANGMDAIPVKTIHFEYFDPVSEMSKILCPTNDGSKGKLTLKRVYTTFERSDLKYSLYEFQYNTTYSENGTKTFDYGQLKQDRWGSYRSNDHFYQDLLEWFPYTYQDKSVQDQYAKAFKISDIILPSGGSIHIEYESDDYAYVQDKRAGQMCFIEGFNKGGNTGITPDLYNAANDMNTHIVIKLPFSCPQNEVKTRYFENVDQLYFDFYVDLFGTNTKYGNTGNTEKKDRVRGYLNIDKNNIDFIADPNDAGKVEKIVVPYEQSIGENSVNYNPVSLIAGQALRTSLQKYFYAGYTQSGSPKDAILAVTGAINDISAIFKGWERKLFEKGYAKNVDVSKSWVRLANGNFQKLGGGSRVRSISLDDNWENMDPYQSSYTYKQEYEYTTEKKINDITIRISSGVASWEPVIGREENLHISQVAYKEKVILAPDNFFYTEKPYCEGLFPGPTIGYSEVKVKNVPLRQNNDLTSNGYNISRFYTAKDFPTIVSTDTKQNFLNQNKFGFMFFTKKTNAGASQGFVIETNDMHGKIKEETSYNEQGGVIESTSYKYFTKSEEGINKLSNEVTTINQEGTKATKELGVTVTASQEFYESGSESDFVTVPVNVNILYFAFVTIPIPTVFLGLNRSATNLRTASTTKHIHSTGIIKQVTKVLNGSSATTENIAFDLQTGKPVMTRVHNEFGDFIYNTAYPAYWGVPGMGQASESIGAEGWVSMDNTYPQFVKGVAQPATDVLSPGDELMIGYPTDDGIKYFRKLYTYYYTAGPGSLQWAIVDNDNREIPKKAFIERIYYYKVIRSHKRNNLDKDVYSYASLSNPIDGSGQLYDNSTLNILNASAVEYSQQWPVEKNMKYENLIGCEDSITDHSNDTTFLNLLKALGQTNTWCYPNNIYSILNSAGIVSNPSDLWLGEPLNQLLYTPDNGSPCDNIPTTDREFNARVGECEMSVKLSCQPLPINDDNKPVSTRDNNSSRLVSTWDVNLFDWGSGGICDGGIRSNNQLLIDNQNCYACASLVCNECIPDTLFCVPWKDAEPLNPYSIGFLGNWRLFRSWNFHGIRSSAGAYSNVVSATNTNIRKDGIIADFSHFWRFVEESGKKILKSFISGDPVSPKWVETEHITIYDSKGNALESRDALKIPSAAVYDQNNQFVIVAAKNARHRELAFESFEEWPKPGSSCGFNNCFLDNHFDFFDPDNYAYLTAEKSHSGKVSLKIPSGNAPGGQPYKATKIIKMIDFNDEMLGSDYFEYAVSAGRYGYSLRNHGYVHGFCPWLNTSKEYIISAWLAESELDGAIQITTYSDVNATVQTSTYEFYPPSTVQQMDGWRRLYEKFTIPANTLSIKISLTKEESHGVVYFDDIRIHPFDAQMQTFVYDYYKNRLMATHDENNYTTFYEYDDAGQLVRTKKETDKGIRTIKEQRSYMPSQRSL